MQRRRPPLYMESGHAFCRGLRALPNPFSHRICAVSMERLWSLAGATSGNRWQMNRLRQGRKRAKTVAAGCNPLPPNLDGKEGVDGSSPSEGLSKVPAKWHFIVVCPLNTRTHSGHIRGTRDASRRLATPSDTTSSARDDRMGRQNACKHGGIVVRAGDRVTPSPQRGGHRLNRGASWRGRREAVHATAR